MCAAQCIEDWSRIRKRPFRLHVFAHLNGCKKWKAMPPQPTHLLPLSVSRQERALTTHLIFARSLTSIVLQYSHPNSGVHKMKTPISPNDLFLAQMNHGYKSFLCEASKCGSTWSCFAGAAYANASAIIEDDTMQTPTLTDAPIHDNQPENAVTVEYDERVDFAPLPNVPNRFEVSEGAHSQIPEGDPQLFRI